MKHKSPEHMAREAFMKDIVGGLHKQRLAKVLRPKPPEKKEEEDLGGYDKLQAEFDHKE